MEKLRVRWAERGRAGRAASWSPGSAPCSGRGQLGWKDEMGGSPCTRLSPSQPQLLPSWQGGGSRSDSFSRGLVSPPIESPRRLGVPGSGAGS